VILIRSLTISLLLMGGCFAMFAETLEASDDIAREMGYINSLRSSNLPTVSLESTLPSVETPPVVVQEQEEIQVAASY